MISTTYKNFEVTTDSRGVTTVSLNVPGRAMNVLNRDVMAELDQIIQDIEISCDIELVVFRSGKESGFLAGADVNAIAEIESASEARQIIEDGQLLFQRIEWLAMPTVAVIHGPCLGGGLELALACNHRVARDNSSTKIGLPEIKLGLIPAWGGTQRLPKRVGLSAALPMILAGKHLGADESLEVGLVDRAIAPAQWEEELDRFIGEVLTLGSVVSPNRRPLWRRIVDATSMGRAITLRMASRAIRSKATNYPALTSALKAIRLGFKPGPDGFACERTEFVKLLASATCRNLLGLFFARERARNLTTWSPADCHAWHDRPIRSVGIVGAGAMGAGIGGLAAYRGFDVVLKEINREQAQAGRHRIEKLIGSLAKRKGWESQQRREVVNRVAVSCDDSSLSDCDLVIEAVVERDDIKKHVFEMLDHVTPIDAILASNTSSLSVTRISEATQRASQVAGLHFFNPVHRMELVEVVRAGNTDEETIARLVGFVRALGKTPIVTADSPGFLVNRVLFPYLGESVLMVGEGWDVAKIDRQIRRFGMPMGPLELLDQVGLDVALHVAKSLDSILPGVAPVVDRLSARVDEGWLGKKSGVGFYRYKNGKRGDPTDAKPSGPSANRTHLDPGFIDDGLTVIQRRLVFPMMAESIRCLEEHVVDEPWAVDLAMVLGTGFAPHLGGPLHLTDAIGHGRVLGNLTRLESIYGKRFAAPQRLVATSDRGNLFFPPSQSQNQLESASL
jgi:3-hydroxyacyl-CoA dehydrogenase/enoyl-CoA hydratase/carnithine racemase